MADSVEMQDIRKLDVDKALKGFALISYIFKNDCAISTMQGDSLRWYQETSADLTATAPQTLEVSPLSTFPNLEPTWTRNVSYPIKYGAESFMSMEDLKSSDVSLMARTLLRLTRAVAKQVDTAIFNVLTENLSPSNIQTFATTAIGGDQWDAASYAGNPIKDILHAKRLIADQGYDTNGAVLYINTDTSTILMDWLIAGKGSSIPNFASDKVETGVLTKLLGVTIKQSVNVTSDNAVMFLPKTSCTWKSFQQLTAKTIVDEGIGSKVRVYESGIAILTDPKSVVLITDILS